ncbi:DinG family ATP-dependent helicase YoaA [hydrothermal vent metagenome]|uniref:DNA 5'-3' helicase n=1 Tax=hydrothermal vent metagenome TaxID=652676 RepID=A0A3B0YI63_9ZZZZ
MSTSTNALGTNGALASEISGFAPRPQQQQMAAAVEQALSQGEALIVEAGTGTGKTFAYLVPALLSGRKVIVSTGTRHLQDQLFHRDLPTVRSALGIPLKAALLKGRANYLCQHRLLNVRAEGRLPAPEQIHQLESIHDWSGRTVSGDIAELSSIAEDAAIWSKVTSTADNCLGQQCEYLKDCCVIKARREAQDADLVVINHHLLCADMVLKEAGFGELLPGAEAFIIDEAHQLPETASRFFGVQLSSRQLIELAQDSSNEFISETAKLEGLPDVAQQLEHAVAEVRLVMGEGEQRTPWAGLADKSGLQTSLDELDTALNALTDALVELAKHSRGLDNCHQRAVKLQLLVKQTTREPPENHVHWFETWRQSFRINLTPLDVAENFSAQRQELPSRWVFTSATLSVNGGFEHFARQLGLEAATRLQLDSPFDYQNNALFYLPNDLPEPNAPDFTESMLDEAERVINAARGRTFLLFTSYRALHIASRRLQASCDYPLLVQGRAPRNELLERFRELGNAVLLGTSSFWEGVDVRGEALSCVIIDKLPFASPGDPVWQARIDALKERGGNPFMEEQLPHAVITLKQGVGRLIRDMTDRGVLMLCDRRLVKKSYGRVFLNSLPDMRRTREFEDVKAFFEAGDVMKLA